MNYTKEESTKKVEQDYQNSLKSIEEKRLLGTFLVGPNLTTITIFFPTTQDIAINCAPLNAWFNESENGGNRWIDFRLIIDLLCEKESFISNIFITDIYVLNPIYQKIFTKIRKEMTLFSIKDWLDGSNLNILSTLWTQLFEHYFQFREGVQDKIFNSFTKTEEKALIFCLEEIGDEGILSISEAIRKSGISRPVFTSMLDKLDRYKGAEIKNMGVKGTYINFYDHILSKFEIS